MVNLSDLNRIAAAVGGVPVWACMRGSPAERAGVKSGDVILEVNGQRTHTLDDYVAAQKTDAERMEMLVLRDGREVRLSLEYDALVDPESAMRSIVDDKLMPQGRPKKDRGGSA